MSDMSSKSKATNFVATFGSSYYFSSNLGLANHLPSKETTALILECMFNLTVEVIHMQRNLSWRSYEISLGVHILHVMAKITG